MVNPIAYFIGSCVVLIAMLLSYKIMSEHKEKIHWPYVTLVIIFAVIMTLEDYYKMSSIKTLTSIIAYFLMYYALFRQSLKKTLYYCIVIWGIGMFVDMITMSRTSILPLILKADTNMLRYIDTYILAPMIIIICKIPKLRKWIKELYEKIKKKNLPYFQIMLISTILISLSYTLYYLIIGAEITLILKWGYPLALTIGTLICIYIHQEYTNYSLKEANNYLIKSNEFYINVVTDYKEMKHNIIHQLNGIKSVSNEETIKLIEDLVKKYRDNTKNVRNIEKMPIGINGIIHEKIYTFPDESIRVEIYNSIESNVFQNLTPRSYNLLCESIGILLENALEASSKTKEKILMIDMKETEETYQIKIINSTEDELDIEKFGTYSYTTKENGHGIGLFSLIGRKKLKIKSTIINDLFFNEIIIEKKIISF